LSAGGAQRLQTLPPPSGRLTAGLAPPPSSDPWASGFGQLPSLAFAAVNDDGFFKAIAPAGGRVRRVLAPALALAAALAAVAAVALLVVAARARSETGAEPGELREVMLNQDGTTTAYEDAANL
jgi:hypothetical protein